MNTEAFMRGFFEKLSAHPDMYGGQYKIPEAFNLPDKMQGLFDKWRGIMKFHGTDQTPASKWYGHDRPWSHTMGEDQYKFKRTNPAWKRDIY